MSRLPPDELLSRCVMVDNPDEQEVEFPEGWMFMPDRCKARWETSVILHGGQSVEELDNAGKYIERKRKSHPTFLGRCVCSVGDVESVDSLTVDPQPGPISEFHANILGWSNDQSQQMLEAEKLAMRSTYVKRAS